jgi:hypothetical protein
MASVGYATLHIVELHIPNKQQTNNKQKTNKQIQSLTRRSLSTGISWRGEWVVNKAIGTIDIDESLEVEIGRSLHALRGTAPLPQPASDEHEVTADNLGTLLRRMTDLSMGEVDSLIDELQRLRKKLETDVDLIERAIARHSEHSQGVMQLTRLIADNVKKLPNPAS